MANITAPGSVRGSTLGMIAKETLDATKTYVIWEIPPRTGTITVQVAVISAGNYRVELTASPIEDVQDDNADWFDLYGSDQSVSRQKACFSSVTAVKVTRVSGSHRACIRGQ